jgi:DNA-binding transcriptional LysR family regulator
MVLDPRRLIDLLGIAEHGSFTKAAAVRRISQPALSNSMALLEKELGVRVLERSRHGAALTDYGALLVRHAQALTSLLARAADEVQLKKQGLEGRLSIGASPLACVTLVPDTVAQIGRKSPHIVVQVFERSDDQLIHGLRTGEFDVVVSAAGSQADPPGVARERLMSDRAIVMVRRRHPLAYRKNIALKDLRDAQWVLPNTQTAMWRHIEALFAAENEPWPASYVTTDSMLALRSLITRTDSVTISSPHLVQLELAAGQLVGIPLRKSHFVREIVLRTRSGQELSPLAQRFVMALRAEAAVQRGRP